MTVTIEPLAHEHIDGLLVVADDPTLTWTSSVPAPCERQHVEAWIAEATATPCQAITFAVLVDAVVAGAVTLKRLDAADGSAELSFWVGSAFRGRGAAKAAGRLAMVHAFDVLGAPYVHAHVLKTSNPASLKTLQGLGFVQDATRADMPTEGRFAERYPGDAWTFLRCERGEMIGSAALQRRRLERGTLLAVARR
jgi:RimJ/RimL family protein N-acetyltransferase